MTDLELTIDPSALSLFLPLMQKGVGLPLHTGCSIRQFLCDQMGISDTYLDQRVQTLFLDARPVDDVDTAVLHDGATLALSAAMPGLLGATMRKGGHYAAFRRSISLASATPGTEGTGNGRITLKLFNMVAQEAGPGLLEKGGWIDGRDLNRIAEYHPEVWGQVFGARIDSQPADPRQAFSQVAEAPSVRLTVRVGQPAPSSTGAGQPAA